MKRAVWQNGGVYKNSFTRRTTRDKGAYIASVTQTPPTPELKKEQADLTRLDHAIQQMQTAREHLPTVVRHLAADGWYAKKKYVDAVVAEGLHVVTKLRCDANMRFRYTGEPTDN